MKRALISLVSSLFICCCLVILVLYNMADSFIDDVVAKQVVELIEQEIKVDAIELHDTDDIDKENNKKSYTNTEYLTNEEFEKENAKSMADNNGHSAYTNGVSVINNNSDILIGGANGNGNSNNNSHSNTKDSSSDGHQNTSNSSNNNQDGNGEIDKNGNSDEDKNGTKSNDVENTGTDSFSKMLLKENKLDMQKIKKIKDDISLKDKIEIATMVMSRLTENDINNIKNMILDGITEAEKKIAKEMVYGRFTELEIAKIKELIRNTLNR